MPLKFPEYMTLWTESETQSVKKDKFFKELMQLLRTLSTTPF